MRVCIYAGMQAGRHVDRHVGVYACMRACLYARARTCTLTHTYIHVYAHAHSHAHAHARDKSTYRFNEKVTYASTQTVRKTGTGKLSWMICHLHLHFFSEVEREPTLVDLAIKKL